MSELDDLEAQEEELLAQLAAKRQKIKDIQIQQQLAIEVAAHLAYEAEQKRLAAIKVATVEVVNVVGNMVYFRNEQYRDDVLKVFQSTEGRMWKPQDKANAIPVGKYEWIISELGKLPNVVLKTDTKFTSLINSQLYEPDYICDLAHNALSVKVRNGVYTYDLRQIPGHQWSAHFDRHLIPLSEGWRLHEYSLKVNSFTWTDNAKEFVLTQLANRLKLDEIAKAKDIELDIPLLKAKLKPFQKIGIKFFELNGVRGILGDEMGTGKTLQMIGLIVHMKYKALVICPAPLKENWIREIRKFAPHLTTYTCQGVTPQKYDIMHIMAHKPDVVIINYDILGRSVDQEQVIYKNYNDEVITEEEFLKGGFGYRKVVTETTRYPWVELFNLYNPDIAILDEGHYIKNVDSNRSKAARKLEMKSSISLTGTPVLNRPNELWALLNLADPKTFPSFDKFTQQYTADGKVVRNVAQLQQVLRPLMIRRLKKDIMPELDPINRINSYYELSVKGKKLYDRVLAGIFEVLAEWNPNQAGEQKSVTNLLVQIQRLKQVVAYDAIEGTADLATEILDASTEDGPKNKVLIFSQFKATTYAISRRLGNEALSFVSLSAQKEFVTAQSHEQQRLIDQFQSDDSINFLCVTEKTAKEGHNITAAKSVIFNDLFWTPAGHQQAEARAYGRISDLHTIDSYYRIGINTISEKIQDLLATKMAIIEQAVEGVEASRQDTSIIHELMASLKEEMWSIKKKK